MTRRRREEQAADATLDLFGADAPPEAPRARDVGEALFGRAGAGGRARPAHASARETTSARPAAPRARAARSPDPAAGEAVRTVVSTPAVSTSVVSASVGSSVPSLAHDAATEAEVALAAALRTGGAGVDPYAALTPEMAALAAAVDQHGLDAVVAALDDGQPQLPAAGAVPGATANAAVTVSTLTQTAKEVVEGAFMPLWVRGEISDFKAHRNGHWYFCLRDQVAQVRCVIWARDARRLPAMPDDGMQVVALGQVSVYAARGDLQLVVKNLEAQGDGLWRKALERTRARLAADGLLDPARRRALPRFPRRVAVITSPDGAALQDIRAVVHRRCPTVELVVVPAKVQGDGAAEELRAAVERVGRWRDVDVVIIGRGGGAREDLWAFNDEQLARAVAACPIPIVSAVGHEVDVTICDLVADLRAPTPSAAAESVVPVLDDVRAEVRALAERLSEAAEWQVATARERLGATARALAVGAARHVERRRAALESTVGRLHALSPLATLGRGYAVARSPEGRSLARVADFPPGAPFELVLQDGTVRARTEPFKGA